ncbi:MAG: sulfite exporter TauE/SafE family protein [Deltaproteobacteria bacterium]|nr:sulfite exporter TauE/SafE family protein [Deltaproteobacteria bacterium]
MEWTIILKYILVGLSAGVASGFFGIGGGLVMVPALVFFFGYSQHMAQGTSLAVLILPVGLLAAVRYHQSGNLNLIVALWIALGLIVGAWLGAHVVHFVSEGVLKKMVGVLFLLVGFKYLFAK